MSWVFLVVYYSDRDVNIEVTPRQPHFLALSLSGGKPLKARRGS